MFPPPQPHTGRRENRNSAEEASAGGRGSPAGASPGRCTDRGRVPFFCKQRQELRPERGGRARQAAGQGRHRKEGKRKGRMLSSYTLPGPSAYLPFVHPDSCPGEYLRCLHFIDRKPRLSHGSATATDNEEVLCLAQSPQAAPGWAASGNSGELSG